MRESFAVMASTSSWMEDRANSSEKSPHFFKIILANTIQEGKLEIPRNFMRKHGKSLEDLVFLEVPSGLVWQIGLAKCDDQVWLQNGWQEFAEHFSLDYGHLIVFRYGGNSNFHVLIFDRSAFEIEYASSSTNGGDPNFYGEVALHKIEEIEDDDSVTSFDDSSASRKRKMKMSSCIMPCKRRETRSSLQTLAQSFRNEKTDINIQARENSGSKRTTNQQIPLPEKFLSMVAYCKAAISKSKNPYFRVIMQKSYVQPAYTLNIPIKFARRHFIKEQGYVNLMVSDRRRWLVKYKVDNLSQQPRAIFSYGWKEFAIENHLEVGDVCRFELIKGSEISLKVVNFRVIEDANLCLRESKLNTSKETASEQVTQKPSHPSITLGESEELTLEYPSFKVVMLPFYLH